MKTIYQRLIAYANHSDQHIQMYSDDARKLCLLIELSEKVLPLERLTEDESNGRIYQDVEDNKLFSEIRRCLKELKNDAADSDRH
jgi:hypothetical protein